MNSETTIHKKNAVFSTTTLLNPAAIGAHAACLAPVRFLWQKLRRLAPLRAALDNRFLYPSLPHIRRRPDYPSGPLLVAGFFSSAHGIGEAARVELEARRAQGQEVFGIDIGPAFGLSDMEPPQGLSARDAAPAHGPLLLHCNAPEAGRALQYLGRRLTAERRIIGYWAWELEAKPHGWERAYAYLDELWLPSRHVAQAFVDAPISMRVKAHPVNLVPDAGYSRVALGLPSSCERACLFLCMADCRSDLRRKNIYGTIRAFGAALGNHPHAALAVKLQHTKEAGRELQRVWELCRSYRNIHVLDRLYSREERNSLLHRCDIFVSLHRAEGFGLPLAEALCLGKKIIATAYAGPLDFLTPHNSALIPYTLVPVCGDTPNYADYANAAWAEPDLAAAITAMRASASQAARQKGIPL